MAKGGVRIWSHIGRHIGAEAISLRVIEVSPGRSPGIAPAECDDVLFVTEGTGTIFLDGKARAIKPDTGIYVRPGVGVAFENPGPEPLVLVSAQCPEPEAPPGFAEPVFGASLETPEVPAVYLWEREAQPTADRWYRVVVDEAVGSTQVTQFVGAIPPGRAPDHFHEYEEVLCILAGEGRMWAGDKNTRIGVGSCVYLPRKQMHCVENTGSGELRLLGVFYPAGSPAAREDPGGSQGDGA